MTGHCSSFQAAIFDSSRSVALRVGICTLQPKRCSSRSSPAKVYSTPNRRRTNSAIRASVQHWSLQPHAAGPASNTASKARSWSASSLQRAPPGPLEARACRPPEAKARRQRFADIRVTLKRRATSPSLAPASNKSATRNGLARDVPAPRPPAHRHRDTSSLRHSAATPAVTNRRNPHR
jgi:hypothetical protein